MNKTEALASTNVALCVSVMCPVSLVVGVVPGRDEVSHRVNEISTERCVVVGPLVGSRSPADGFH